MFSESTVTVSTVTSREEDDSVVIVEDASSSSSEEDDQVTEGFDDEMVDVQHSNWNAGNSFQQQTQQDKGAASAVYDASSFTSSGQSTDNLADGSLLQQKRPSLFPTPASVEAASVQDHTSINPFEQQHRAYVEKSDAFYQEEQAQVQTLPPSQGMPAGTSAAEGEDVDVFQDEFPPENGGGKTLKSSASDAFSALLGSAAATMARNDHSTYPDSYNKTDGDATLIFDPLQQDHPLQHDCSSTTDTEQPFTDDSVETGDIFHDDVEDDNGTELDTFEDEVSEAPSTKKRKNKKSKGGVGKKDKKKSKKKKDPKVTAITYEDGDDLEHGTSTPSGPDGLFKPQVTGDPQRFSQQWSSRVLSSVPSLQARSASTPQQEAWQDQDRFDDEIVAFEIEPNRSKALFDDGAGTDDDDSKFMRSLSFRDKPHYRTSLLLHKQSRSCWCLVILVLILFLALIIPLSVLARDNKQLEQQLASAVQPTPPPSSSTVTTAVPTPSLPPEECVDQITLVNNRTCFDTKTSIEFSFTQCFPAKLDWIGLYPSNSVYYGRLWKDYINWIWTCGTLPCNDTQVTEDLPLEGVFNAPAMKPGNYQIFLVLDSRWPYRYLASSDTFTVSDSC